MFSSSSVFKKIVLKEESFVVGWMNKKARNYDDRFISSRRSIRIDVYGPYLL